MPFISISHNKNRVIAIASPRPVGIDIETIEERNANFLSSISKPEELRILSALELDQQQNETLLWSAKESTAKAQGSGLDRGPRAMELVALTEEGRLIMYEPERDAQYDVSVWQIDDSFITVSKDI